MQPTFFIVQIKVIDLEQRLERTDVNSGVMIARLLVLRPILAHQTQIPAARLSLISYSYETRASDTGVIISGSVPVFTLAKNRLRTVLKGSFIFPLI